MNTPCATSDASGAGPSAQDAARTLDSALNDLERCVDLFLERRRAERVQSRAIAMMQADRGRLASDLDVSKAREDELLAAADAASLALENAIAEVRTVLGAP
jgi:hypothetical protein